MSELINKKANFTVKLLLDAACELIQTLELEELSFKKVSEHAEISQRTMFRYFTTRDAFLDALTARLHGELDLPNIPEDIEALPDFVSCLYHKLDAQPRKVMVLLSSDLFPKVLNTSAKQREQSLKSLLSKNYPRADKKLIVQTTANLRYIMSASSWRYYRKYYEFDLRTSIDCANMMLTQALRYLNEVN